MNRYILQYMCLYCFVFIGSLQASWSPPDDLSQTGQSAQNAQIAVDSAGNATAVWQSSDGTNVIIQASTKPFGGSWQAISDDLTLPGQYALNPQIAVDFAGNATAVWRRSNGSKYIIQASTKPFGGSWQISSDDLSLPGQDAFSPQIAVDPTGNATAVWYRSNGSHTIIQASTKPFGGSWQVSSDDLSLPGQNASAPQIAVDSSGNVMAVWSRSNGTNIIIQASTKPFGSSWQTVPDDLSLPGLSAFSPQIAVTPEGNAMAVWGRGSSGNVIIQASTKPLGGSWQTIPNNLSLTELGVGSPEIALDPAGNATAVWTRSDGSKYIVQASTKPFGESWQTSPDNLSLAGQSASLPQIAVDPAGNATVVWYRSNGTNTIIQAATKPFGGSWQTVPDDLSQTGQNAYQPQIAVDSSGNATAVWQRYNGSYNIIQAAQKNFGLTVTGISPNFGPSSGGTTVTIAGTNFFNVTDVLFGTTSASSFTVTSLTMLTAISPPGAGTVDVRVMTSSETSPITILDQYSYFPKPLAPSHFRGTFKKRHHHTHKWLLKTHWKLSPSSDVKNYRIYKRSKLVETVSASKKLHFKDHLLWRSSAKKFRVSAVTSLNEESTKKKLKIKD